MGKLGLISVVAGASILAGCGGSSSSSTETDLGSETQVQLSVPFAVVAGTEPVTCGTTYTGLGVAGSDITFADIRMFVSDLAVVTDQGEVIPVALDGDIEGQNADVALLDFRDKADVNDNGDLSDVCVTGTDANPGFNDTVEGSISLDQSVTVESVRFSIGVPFELNHANPAGAEEPLRSPGLAAGMTWNWQNGYKFLAIDVLPVGSARWNVHLGSTGCPVVSSELEQGEEPEPCTADNRLEVTLPLGAVELENAAIQIDYAALVSASNLGQDDGGAPGCMSFPGDPECDSIFEHLALPFGESSNEGGDPNVQVFSLIER